MRGIDNLEGGGSAPTGEIEITENGVHTVAGYARANVAVPGVQLVDINPSLTRTMNVCMISSNASQITSLPVQGYSTIKIYPASKNQTIYWRDVSNTQIGSSVSVAYGGWREYTVPDNAVTMGIIGSGQDEVWFSCIGDQSPSPGVRVLDINASKNITTDATNPGWFRTFTRATDLFWSLVPCCGYKKLALWIDEGSQSNIVTHFCWVYSDGTSSSDDTSVLTTGAAWTNYIDIPSGVVAFRVCTTKAGIGTATYARSICCSILAE